jgi:hypothetical protein
VGQSDVVWHHVDDLAEFEAHNVSYGDSVLFLCWRPGWGNTMASEVLRSFEEQSGLSRSSAKNCGVDA